MNLPNHLPRQLQQLLPSPWLQLLRFVVCCAEGAINNIFMPADAGAGRRWHMPTAESVATLCIPPPLDDIDRRAYCEKRGHPRAVVNEIC